MRNRMSISSRLCRPRMMEQLSTNIAPRYCSPRVPNSPSPVFLIRLVTSTCPLVRMLVTKVMRESFPITIALSSCTQTGAFSQNWAKSSFSASILRATAELLGFGSATSFTACAEATSSFWAEGEDIEGVGEEFTELSLAPMAMLPAFNSLELRLVAVSDACRLAYRMCSVMADIHSSASSGVSASISKLYSPLKLTTKICLSLYFLFSWIISVLARWSSPFSPSPKGKSSSALSK
mmetsp:Transcript_2077/g.4897  ORF Transcript_2077/g.4897 Transcript_2077/m.4897 type:complete len:236 (+) Transcript_2077:1102-1809(+)